MPLLLDTSVAIDIRDGNEDVASRFFDVAQKAAISLTTVIELTGGVYSDARYIVQRRVGLDMLLLRLRVIPIDHAIVEAYGAIVEAQGFSRRKILDRLIAATAIVHGLTLVTTNGADFADIPGLALEVWPVG